VKWQIEEENEIKKELLKAPYSIEIGRLDGTWKRKKKKVSSRCSA
jgi:hypothetical protein